MGTFQTERIVSTKEWSWERRETLQRFPIWSGWSAAIGDKAETAVWDWQEGGNLPTGEH